MKKSLKNGYLLFVFDVLIVSLSFLSVIFFSKTGRIHYLEIYAKPFLGFLVVWIAVSLINEKYKPKAYFFEVVNSIGKTFLYSSFIIISSIYVFHRFSYSRVVVFGTIFLSSFISLLFYGLYFINKKYKFEREEEIKFETDLELEENYLPVEINEETFKLPDIPFEMSIHNVLKTRYLAKLPLLFDFIEKNVPLYSIPQANSLIINSANIFNIQNYEPNSQYLFLNLRKINDFRRFNMYFIQANENMHKGGYYIGTCETNEIRRRNIKRKFPLIIADLINSFDFFFHRVLPKLPYLKSVYFFLTKGSNRAVSKAEILGRLKFCGFEIIDTTNIENQFYFIVEKVAMPKSDLNPSYGPLINLKRIGKNGNIIKIFKFRTMHPYSEFLQDYVFKQNLLDEGGKLKNDFRITEWGRTFRKLWIDELPQFINFFRGEVKLVGVRALSEHYFSLYPQEIQELRTRTKPGLVPPFYVDMPKTFEEIIESERKYLVRYFKNPILTDIRYFFLAFYNIAIKRARSK